MGKKVLLVEDDPDIREMMRLLLGLYGFQVSEAKDGYEGVEKALEVNPDLILMDMAMPVMDGLESTRAMRRHERLEGVPIVAVSAYGDFYRERALEAGCTDVMGKPLDFSQLRPIVEQYMTH